MISPNESCDLLILDRIILDSIRLRPNTLAHINWKEVIIGARYMVIFTRRDPAVSGHDYSRSKGVRTWT